MRVVETRADVIVTHIANTTAANRTIGCTLLVFQSGCVGYPEGGDHKSCDDACARDAHMSVLLLK